MTQEHLNLMASAYLETTREFLRANYGAQWDRFPEAAQQAAVVASAVQTLLLPSVQPITDVSLTFANIGSALGAHTAHLPDETFTFLMGEMAKGAGDGRAKRVAQVLNWPTMGNA